MGHIAGPEMVTREFAGVQWETDIQDFWQANRSLLPVAQEAIIDSGAARPGEDWWDLYGGAGVFARVLSLELGAGGSVATVEGNRPASQRARDLFAGVPESDSAPIRVICGRRDSSRPSAVGCRDFGVCRCAGTSSAFDPVSRL